MQTIFFADATNPLAIFSEIMDTIFKDAKECIWYLDNILIFSGNTEKEHQVLVEQILQLCIKHGLAVNLPKSKFYV